MDVGRRRSTGGRGTATSVVAGSVWESRMKIDEVKGGFKVFNGSGEETAAEDTDGASTKSKRCLNNDGNNNNQIGGSVSNGGSTKRKTWKSESNPVQIARGNSDGIKRSPIQAKRVVRSEERSPVGVRRQRSNELVSKEKSGSVAAKSVELDDKEEAVKSEVGEIEKSPVEIGSDEAGCCKDFGVVCQDNVVSSGDVEAPKSDDLDDQDDHGDENDDGDDHNDDDEIGVDEKKSIEVEEIKTQETKPQEIKTPETTKPGKASNVAAEKVVVSEVKRVSFERKLEVGTHNSNRVFHQKQPEPISLNVKRQPPVIKRATVHSSFATKGRSPTKFSPSNSDESHSFPETHSRLQSFVDLIMWKDISRSVFIFGVGTFTIISSSYTKDLNISLISVLSYLGLVYLAAIFLFRSIICRGVIDMDYTNYVVGEEEAIWLLKVVLPYLNEFLLKLKALFSGDPATTMKLAAMLFILARCGSSVTIWTMAKLGFFGVFTVPKLCSLYSPHITAYANFWVRRFRDAWDSCSHKKGVMVTVFLLVWNLSSIVARIWAVFMLFVAFRYYQQTLVADDWVEDGPEGEEAWYEPIGLHRQGPGPTIEDQTKLKKIS